MALVFTAAKYTGYSTDLLVTGELTFWQHPWTLVTSALPHGGALHLVFNLYWLWVFGSVLETTFGKVKTLGLMLLLAAGSDAAQFALSGPGIGLSGIVYGLFGFLYVLGRSDDRFRTVVDKRTAQMFVGWFLLCIVATYMEVMNIANVAHGVGALLGGVTALAVPPARASSWTKPKFQLRYLGAALAAASLLLLSIGASAYLRPQVNLSSSADDEAFHLALEASEGGRLKDAEGWYRRAIELEPDHSDNWHNLAIVYEERGELDESLEAFERAYELEPDDEGRQAVSRAHGRIGNRHIEAERYDEALSSFEAALEANASNHVSTFNRGVVLQRLERHEEAKQAFQKALELQPDNEVYRDATSDSSSH